MRNKLNRVLSLTLAFAVAVTGTACSSKKKDADPKGKKITADSPWFDVKETHVAPEVDMSRELDYCTSMFSGADDRYVVFFTYGSYAMPDADYVIASVNMSYRINLITVCDRATGEIVNTIDLSDFLDMKYLSADSVSYADNRICIRVDGYASSHINNTMVEAYLDPVTGDVLSSDNITNNGRPHIERIIRVGTHQVDLFKQWDERETGYYILDYHSGENKNEIMFKSDDSSIWEIPAILSVDSDTDLILTVEDDGINYYELKMSTGEIIKAEDDEYDWISGDGIYDTYSFGDGQSYLKSSHGISKLNFEEKKMETVFDYSWCNVNQKHLEDLDLAEISDGKLLLAGEFLTASGYADNTSDIVIMEFTEAGTNPNAGKTILELYNADHMIDAVGDAIVKFNGSNSDFFISVTDRYDMSSYLDENAGWESSDDWETAGMDAYSRLGNDLAMDIMNGDGPDIFLGTGMIGRLNDPDYLIDLTPYVSGMSSDDYFTNIIEGSKTDGKLYQLPLTFSVNGILTDPQYAGASGVGFTVDEYEDFLNNKLNGQDVIGYGQGVYFAKLFAATSERFIKDGSVDLSGPEFAAMAEFVKENVPEKSLSWDELDPDETTTGFHGTGVGAALMKGDDPDCTYVATDACVCGMSNYISYVMDSYKSTAILGYPSFDGRGPLFTPDVSVAVSARSANAEACGEFIRLLLSDEIQQELAVVENGFVLNRKVFREVGQKAVEYYSADNLSDLGISTQSSGGEITNAHIDYMEQNILNCSRMNASDADIALILVEEMQPYFMGQKTLDDVIVIVTDRVQKVINKRG